jgi:hypothetical protein
MKPRMRRPQKYGRNLRKLKREGLNGSIGGNFLGLLQAKQEARAQFFLQSSPNSEPLASCWTTTKILPSNNFSSNPVLAAFPIPQSSKQEPRTRTQERLEHLCWEEKEKLHAFLKKNRPSPRTPASTQSQEPAEL